MSGFMSQSITRSNTGLLPAKSHNISSLDADPHMGSVTPQYRLVWMEPILSEHAHHTYQSTCQNRKLSLPLHSYTFDELQQALPNLPNTT